MSIIKEILQRGASLGSVALACIALLAPAQAGDQLPSGVTLVEDRPGLVVLDVRLPEPELRTDLAGGTRFTLPGYGLLWEDGKPVLPRVRVRLALPAAGRLQVDVEVLESQILAGVPLAVTPAISRISDADDPGAPGQVILRPGALDGFLQFPFPGEVATIGGRGRLRRLPVTTIDLTPVQLLDTEGTVRVARHFRVRVSSPSGGGRLATAGAPQEEQFEKMYSRLVANPGGAMAERMPLVLAPSSAPALAPGSPSGAAPATPLPRPAVPLTPDPGSVVYRLDVDQDGIYRLDVPWITANAPDLLNHNPDAYFITANGVEIPIRVQNTGPMLNAAEFVEFFGEALDEDPLDPDAWQQGDFSDVRPYYIGAATGARLRMSQALTGKPDTGFTPLLAFQDTVRLETNNLFLNSVPDDLADRWYDQPFLRDTNPGRDVTFALPGVDVSGQASLKARVLGLLVSGNISGLHRTTVRVNTIQIDEADYDGVAIYTHGESGGPVTFPAALLTPSSTLRVELPFTRPNPGGGVFTADLIGMDWAEITYPRLFEADQDRLLFSLANQDGEIAVTDFSASDVSVYDVTPVTGGVAAPLHLHDVDISTAGGMGGLTTATLEIAAADMVSATRRLALSAGGGLKPAAVAVFAPPADLTSGGADWLLIGHPALLDQSPASDLSALIALRQSQGLQTRVVTTREAYDSFSHGLEDPQAIRDLIAWALVNWIPAPSFVVLVGDGTYDYKNDYGHAASRNLLPTYIGSQVASPVLTYFAEDNHFAAVIGNDDLPDVMLGRLPVHDLAEAEGVFAKLVAYESLAPGPAWTRRTLFLSDVESGGFEFTMRQVINKFFDRPDNPGVLDPVGPCFSTGTCHNDDLGSGALFHTASMEALKQRNPGVQPGVLAPTMTGWITDAIDLGSAVTYFIGHGGFQQWGRDADIFRAFSFSPDDVDGLSNAGTLTFMININCITGGFHADALTIANPDFDPLYALSEDLLVTPGRGAVGVLAPSHLTFISILGVVTNSIWERLLGAERDRLVGALNLVTRLKFDEIGASTDLRSFSFLADPATRLILPDPGPPGVPAAVSGNAQVSLNWSPGPDAVRFRLERSATGPAGSYASVPLADDTLAGFVDTTVSNGAVYYYRVIGLDGDGMESIPSNLNQDCPAGPGCVVGQPLNPLPPGMPSGFSAVDTSKGGQLQLNWNLNPENDLASYKVRYGTAPGLLPLVKTYSPGTASALLDGLENDVPVYLTIEAANTSSLTSPATPEVEATPRFILGIAPPKDILDLRLSVSGGDVVLDWSQVVEDIYDRPTTVAEYRVFQSAVSPLFPLDEPHRLVSVPDDPAPTYAHAGAAPGPEARFYLVLSRDAAGQDSSAGDGLPAPILDLVVERVTPGTLRLSWSPVTTDYLGTPMFVDHYVVFGGLTPFSRQDVAMLTPLRLTVLATTVDLAETEGDFFSVLAVGVRGSLSPY